MLLGDGWGEVTEKEVDGGSALSFVVVFLLLLSGAL
jgi:hypothetical protein